MFAGEAGASCASSASLSGRNTTVASGAAAASARATAVASASVPAAKITSPSASSAASAAAVSALPMRGRVDLRSAAAVSLAVLAGMATLGFDGTGKPGTGGVGSAAAS